MFSRLVRAQLAAFSALTIFAVSVIVVNYLGVAGDKYNVTADFAAAWSRLPDFASASVNVNGPRWATSTS